MALLTDNIAFTMPFPSTEMLDPHRTKFRIERLDPNDSISKMEVRLPNFADRRTLGAKFIYCRKALTVDERPHATVRRGRGDAGVVLCVVVGFLL